MLCRVVMNREDCASGRVFQTLIGPFVNLFRNAGPEIAESPQASVPVLIFLRKWLYIKHFPVA